MSIFMYLFSTRSLKYIFFLSYSSLFHSLFKFRNITRTIICTKNLNFNNVSYRYETSEYHATEHRWLVQFSGMKNNSFQVLVIYCLELNKRRNFQHLNEIKNQNMQPNCHECTFKVKWKRTRNTMTSFSFFGKVKFLKNVDRKPRNFFYVFVWLWLVSNGSNISIILFMCLICQLLKIHKFLTRWSVCCFFHVLILC